MSQYKKERIHDIIKVTYDELVSLRDNNRLIPGKQYQITDFNKNWEEDNTLIYDSVIGTINLGQRYLGFDVIVEAISKNQLSEEGRVIENENEIGGGVIENCSKWKIWYCLDNDTERFDWVDNPFNTGVIYRMIDEHGNDCPYDFKSLVINDEFTFTATTEDEFSSTIKNNVIKPLYSTITNDDIITTSCQQQRLNCIFIGGTSCQNNFFDVGCYNNILGNDCCDNSFGISCHDNTFGDYDISNHFANNCYGNTFGSNCKYNELGDYCLNNTFEDMCNLNTFGGSCSNNTLTYHTYISVQTRYNTLKNNCCNNTLCCMNVSLGNFCTGNDIKQGPNLLGDRCISNNIYGYRNSFGVYCCNNIVNSNCNTFGDCCEKNEVYIDNSTGIGVNNQFDNGCTQNIVKYGSKNRFGVGCRSNTLNRECHENNFGNVCVGNILYESSTLNHFNENCTYNEVTGAFNHFGISCYKNIINGNKNTFGTYCRENTLQGSSYNNTFGIYCIKNVMNSGCYNNTFGNNSSYNQLSSYCHNNSFGNTSSYNSMGKYCDNNVFGNGCLNCCLGYVKGFISTITSSTQNPNIVGNGSECDYVLLDHVTNCEFKDGVSYVGLSNSTEMSITNYITNVTIAKGTYGGTKTRVLSNNNTSEVYTIDSDYLLIKVDTNNKKEVTYYYDNAEKTMYYQKFGSTDWLNVQYNVSEFVTVDTNYSDKVLVENT